MSEPYIDDWKRNIDEKVQEIRRDLYLGNGRPGLTYRVASNESEIQGLKDREEKRLKKQDRIEVAVWVGVILMILNLIVSHLH